MSTLVSDEFGRLSGHLFEFLHTQNYFVDQLRLSSSPRLQLAPGHLRISAARSEIFPRASARESRGRLQGWARCDAKPQLSAHGDFGTRNVLVDKRAQNPTCLIDFRDIRLGDHPAVVMLDGVLGRESDFIHTKERFLPSYGKGADRSTAPGS